MKMVSRSLIKDTRGNVLIESAFALPILMACVLAMIELGRALITIYFIYDAAADGARYAMVHGSESQSPASPSAIEAVVRSHAPIEQGRLGVTIQQVANDGTVSTVSDGYYFSPGETIRIVTDYNFSYVVPIFGQSSTTFSQFMDAIVMY